MQRNQDMKNRFENFPKETLLHCLPGNNGIVNMGLTCIQYKILLFTQEYYMNRYSQLFGSVYAQDDSARSYDLFDLFDESLSICVKSGIIHGGMIGLFLIVGPLCIISSGVVATVGGLFGAVSGTGHGIFRICTRKFMMDEELREFQLYLGYFSNEPEKERDEIISKILSDYAQYKADKRLRNADKGESYFFATSNSSNKLIIKFNGNGSVNDKWDAMVSYVQAKYEAKQFKNNGKALFVIIFEVLKKSCSETLRNTHYDCIEKKKLSRGSI